MTHVLLDFDKAGAEWVVTAYLANEARMISIVESKKSPHLGTGSLMTGASEEFVLAEHKLIGNATDPDLIAELRNKLAIPLGIWLPRVMSIRQAGKKSNHGLNYRMGYRRFGLENELEEAEAKRLRERYLAAYPNLQLWWDALEAELRNNRRTLSNCFGRRRKFLDTWGPDLFEKATAFKPQSTVADVVNGAMCDAYEDSSADFEPADLLANVHDSLCYQYPVEDWQRAAGFVCKMGFEYLNPELSYSGRKFHIDTTLKIGASWGDPQYQDRKFTGAGMLDIELSNDPTTMATRLKETWEILRAAASTQ